MAPLLAALVVLLPVLRSPGADSYPLSTYPMFATNRGSQAAIATAIGVDGAGEESRLGARAIGGTDEVILAAVTVSAAVRRGEVADLCREIAERLTETTIVVVVIRTEVIDVVEHVTEGSAPPQIAEHGRCPVPR
jgi:hypothetical protein